MMDEVTWSRGGTRKTLGERLAWWTWPYRTYNPVTSYIYTERYIGREPWGKAVMQGVLWWKGYMHAPLWGRTPDPFPDEQD